MMERMCQILRLLTSSGNMCSHIGSLPDFEGTGYLVNTMEEQINEKFV